MTNLPAGEGPASPSGRPGPVARPRDLLWWLRVAAGVAVVLAVLVVAADRLTSSAAVCAACHEMGARAAAWKVSPHANVDCVECHVAPRPWYAFPQTLYDRTRLLGHDTVAHFSAGAPSVVDTRPPGAEPMADAVCLQCHDPNRKPTAGLGVLIDHPKHAKRNGSCVSCHITVAHPTPSRGTALSFMGQCFTCHGLASNAKASAKCTLCHPSDFRMKPKSHDAAKWKQAHGRVALVDPRECEMCHKTAFCDRCHGMRMPHPKGWARNTGHPVYAKRDREVCLRCHGGTADFCSMCHHKAFDPSKGTWVKQHFVEVMNKGASFCLEQCHSPVYCSKCHVEGAAAVDGSAASGG